VLYRKIIALIFAFTVTATVAPQVQAANEIVIKNFSGSTVWVAHRFKSSSGSNYNDFVNTGWKEVKNNEIERVKIGREVSYLGVCIMRANRSYFVFKDAYQTTDSYTHPKAFGIVKRQYTDSNAKSYKVKGVWHKSLSGKGYEIHKYYMFKTPHKGPKTFNLR